MTRRNLILTVLLAAQLLLIVVLFWPRATTATADKLFPQLDLAAVTGLAISDGSRTLALSKKDGTWVLPTAGDFPVDEVRVSDFLTKVAQIDTRRLTASNAANHTRLQVAADKFQRKVEITLADGDPITLLVGSAPNARATHVRSADSNNVYLTSALSTADVRSDIGNWINTVYLQVDPAQVTAFTLSNAAGRFDFAKTPEGEWELAQLAEGETTNQSNVTALLNRLRTLNMIEPLGKEAAPEWNMAAPLAVITLTVQPTTTMPAQDLALAIGAKLADSSGYPVKATNSDYFVKVATYTFDTAVGQQRSDFVTPPESVAPESILETLPVTATDVVSGAVSLPSTEALTATLPLTVTGAVTDSAGQP